PLDRERAAERLETCFGGAGGISLQPDGVAIPHVAKRPRDDRVVDLAGFLLLAARHVGNLDLADPRQAPARYFDQIPLPDLHMIEVEIEPQARMVAAGDAVQRVHA